MGSEGEVVMEQDWEVMASPVWKEETSLPEDQGSGRQGSQITVRSMLESEVHISKGN